jgi:hypothetical protein
MHQNSKVLAAARDLAAQKQIDLYTLFYLALRRKFIKGDVFEQANKICRKYKYDRHEMVFKALEEYLAG